MSIKKFVDESEIPPKYFWFAYRSPHRFGGVFYPIPLNFIVMFWHHVWEWVKFHGIRWRTNQDVLCDVCFEKGWKAAKRSSDLQMESRIDQLEDFINQVIAIKQAEPRKGEK